MINSFLLALWILVPYMSFLSVLMMQTSDSPVFVVDIGAKQNKLKEMLPGKLISY